MARSQATKSAKTKYIVFEVMSILITVLPLAVYVGYGFYNGTPHEKIAIALSSIVGIVFAALNILLKWHIRCGVWIVLLGLAYGLKENMSDIMSLLMTMALTTAVDEFVLAPMAKRYREKFHINKEIDKRI